MKKLIKMTAAAVVLGALSTSAFAAGPGAFFINANIGQSNFHDHSFSNHTDTATAVRAGYAWHIGNAGDFGVEAGYVDLGRASGSVLVNNVSTGFGAKLSGPLLGANYRYTFSNKIYVSARAGWFRSKFDANIAGIGSQSFSGNGAYSGLGVGYDITPHFSLGVNFDEYHGRATVYGTKAKEGVSALSGFAEVRF
ncbi:MAG: porin family protein [Xanthomonadaceae bacterium]|nr:porin family protein [Xanthomonadaceae bacterium]MDE3072684.1 porin family protein [Pseudomonadota bacterium]